MLASFRPPRRSTCAFRARCQQVHGGDVIPLYPIRAAGHNSNATQKLTAHPPSPRLPRSQLPVLPSSHPPFTGLPANAAGPALVSGLVPPALHRLVARKHEALLARRDAGLVSRRHRPTRSSAACCRAHRTRPSPACPSESPRRSACFDRPSWCDGEAHRKWSVLQYWVWIGL